KAIKNIPRAPRNHGYRVRNTQQDGPPIRYLIQK
nr:SirA-like protein [Cronobacter malonaticus]